MKIKDKILSETSEEVKQRVRDTANKLVMKQETLKEDFAIGFAEWCDDNYFRMGNTSFWAESMDWDNDNKFTTKELLEIYKNIL